jgi:hypothetical protein
MIIQLRSLNQILSSDFLINSRYDIVYNFNDLNTYATYGSAGLAQLASDADMIAGDDVGMVTPLTLDKNYLKFTLKEDLHLLSEPDGGANYAWLEYGAPSAWLVNIDYLGKNLNYFNDTVLDERYLRRNDDDTPSLDDTFELGSTTKKWAKIYSTNFIGTASRSLYADVAEIYTCDEEIEVGRLISVCDEGEFEVQATSEELDIKCIGVVSEKPGFLMNEAGEGVTVGLVGKVPVAVSGPVKKGDVIVSSSIKGIGRAAKDPSEFIFGIARSLENKPSADFGLVQCILKG